MSKRFRQFYVVLVVLAAFLVPATAQAACLNDYCNVATRMETTTNGVANFTAAQAKVRIGYADLANPNVAWVEHALVLTKWQFTNQISVGLYRGVGQPLRLFWKFYNGDDLQDDNPDHYHFGPTVSYGTLYRVTASRQADNTWRITAESGANFDTTVWDQNTGYFSPYVESIDADTALVHATSTADDARGSFVGLRYRNGLGIWHDGWFSSDYRASAHSTLNGDNDGGGTGGTPAISDACDHWGTGAIDYDFYTGVGTQACPF